MSELVTCITVLQWVVLAVAGYLLAVTVTNLLTMPRLGEYRSHLRYPRVSILVPARNEEENLPRLIPSLLAQDYPDFEVVVLDDDSTDRTVDVLAESARRDSRLRVVPGLPRPAGWLGKNWACHQLSQSTTSDWILFTDADTVHRPGALRAAMDAALHHQLDFLSALLNQEVRTWSERLVVPFYSIYHVFCTVPFALGRRLRRPRLCAANGQFMLFRRQAYERIGGYAGIRSAVLDDQALATRVVAHELRWRFGDASRFVSCRMYRNWESVVEGFTKSVFTAFNYRLEPFLLTCVGLLLIFFGPLFVAILAASGITPALARLPLAVASILITICLWLAVNRRFRIPLYLVLAYPATVGLALFIAVRSAMVLPTGRATWKGRAIEATGASGSPAMVRPLPGLRTATYVYWYLGVSIAMLAHAYYRIRR